MIALLLIAGLFGVSHPADRVDSISVETEQEAPAEELLPVELRVRVLRGSSNYVLPEGGPVAMLRPSSEVLKTTTGIYLEFGIATEVELVWNGVGSARIQGPGTISWNAGLPAPPVPEGAAEKADGEPEGGLPAETELSILERFRKFKRRQITNRPEARECVRVVVGSIRSAEIEAREPGFELEAAREGWTLEIPSGALRLEGRKNGVFRVAHHGGQPVRVRTSKLRPPGTWPIRISSGSRVDLPAPLKAWIEPVDAGGEPPANGR